MSDCHAKTADNDMNDSKSNPPTSAPFKADSNSSLKKGNNAVNDDPADCRTS